MIVPVDFPVSNKPSPPDLGEFEVDYDIHEEPSDPGSSLLDDCRNFFAAGGILAGGDFGSREYEERPQQTAMALGVAEALIKGSNLCVEAPTGVGKSFAYLVPLIYRSKYCALPSVVSTETINLQEQLMHKDIPMLRELTGMEIKAALAKGRHNYICRRRLDGTLRQ